MPVRGALTLQASPRFIGGFFAPNINLDLALPEGAQGWKLGVLAGPLFANRRYNDYFYSVAPEYATPDRPEYAAHGLLRRGANARLPRPAAIRSTGSAGTSAMTFSTARASSTARS